MNARVFMVLVFSAVFMGIWNSDQKAMDAAIARHKRLNKSIAVFAVRSVETAGREKLWRSKFAGPEQRPVRIAMRASSRIGQSEYVIERHEVVRRQQADAELPIVTLTPISEQAPEPQNISIDDTSTAVEASDVDVADEPATSKADMPESAVPGTETLTESEVESDETLIPETAAIETPVSELTVSQTVVTEIVSEFEQDPLPTPDDSSVHVKPNAIVPQVVDAEEPVNTESRVTDSRVIVAERTTEEAPVDYSAEVDVENSQPVPDSSETELPEPAAPVNVDSAVPSEAVVINETAASTKEAVVDESEDEKSLEDTLFKSREYDMLDVHFEDVIPGTGEPAFGDGATCIPMPRNLASGTWQVIHPSGEFFKITVDRGTLSSADRRHDNSETLETSFCITTSPDGVRWCFIRSFLDSPAPVRKVTTEFFAPGQQ